ncbi:MAG: hypothetical protein HYT89_07595, partial [Candidatus Omnitrophica bacterium]|nr:hypothetical protein [Candidatus Omnitrophota bacterium]
DDLLNRNLKRRGEILKAGSFSPAPRAARPVAAMARQAVSPAPAEAQITILNEPLTPASPAPVGVPSSSIKPAFRLDPVYAWLTDNQKINRTGLLDSYPDDPAMEDQGFTYDQAVAGAALLQAGRIAEAKKIFDFYSSIWDGTGFWTVYHTQFSEGPKTEHRKGMGPTASVALFAISYYAATGDEKALELAEKIAIWIQSLPGSGSGARAAGASNSRLNPDPGTLFSTEDNLGYYALLSALVKILPDSDDDKASFRAEAQDLRRWFGRQVYRADSGLFKRGEGDDTNVLDANSAAVLALGVRGLLGLKAAHSNFTDFDLGTFVGKIESAFAVDAAGEFGASDPALWKGFDFSDSANARAVGRRGVNWVEGTAQMIAVYDTLARYYEGLGDAANAEPYQKKRDALIAANLRQNIVNADPAAASSAFRYTDAHGVRVFVDGDWELSKGRSVASTAWAVLAQKGVNPFSPVGALADQEEPPVGLSGMDTDTTNPSPAEESAAMTPQANPPAPSDQAILDDFMILVEINPRASEIHAILESAIGVTSPWDDVEKQILLKNVS